MESKHVKNQNTESYSDDDTKYPHSRDLKKDIELNFESTSDCGYKSGDISSRTSIGESKSLKQDSNLSNTEQNINFDSGIGNDCFSPVACESVTDIIFKKGIPESESFAKALKKDKLFKWQEVYSQDQDGDTILHLAIVEARSDVIFPLIRLAPHPDFLDITNDLYQTPLHLATLTGKPNIVRRLIVAGATIDIQDHNGNTALHIASRNGDLDCLQAILKPILDAEVEEANSSYKVYLQAHSLSHIINLKNYDGQTCVHLAAAGGFKKVLEHLYDHGANVNEMDGKSGKTALHYSIESVNYDLVRLLLLKCNANPRIKNYAGKTSLHIAWIHSKRKPPKTLPKVFYDLLVGIVGQFEPPSDSESYSSSDEVDLEEIVKQQN